MVLKLSYAMTVAMLLIPIFNHPVAGQNGHTKEMANVMTATAIWEIEDEGAVIGTVVLVVTKSHDGIDVHLTADREEGLLSGHFFTDDNEIFEIDSQLDSATLAPVNVDVCGFGQHDENGDCIEVIETLEIEAEWTSVDPKVTSVSKMTTIHTANKQMFLLHNTFKTATASGSLNDSSLGDALIATISKAKALQIDFGAPSKTPVLSKGGNKGFVAANAIWLDTIIEGEPANVFLRVIEQIRGETTVKLQIGIEIEDGPQFLQGELTIPADGDDVFSMDMREATASLSPVSITVCDIELANDCTGAPSTTYTIEATWDGVESSASASKFTDKIHFGDVKQSIEINAVSMEAEATGSIEGGNMGETDRADLFHFSTLKIDFN